MKLIISIILSFFAIQAQAGSLLVREVAPGLYVHQGIHEDLAEGYHGDISNIGFIIGSKGVAVIDTGGSLKIGQQLREAIREITALPILYVINTHVHPDHVFGNAAFVQEKTMFVGHVKLPDAMELRKESYLRTNKEWLGADFAGSELVKPTTTVKDKLELDLGDRILELKAYPVAHTTTDITVFDRKTSTLWAGDLLFVERAPSIDGDLKGWLGVLEELKMLPVLQAVPGHGPIVKDWTAALNDEQRYLSALLNDIRASIKKGEVMEKAMGTAAQTEKDRWVLFDIVNRRNVNIVYPGLEWE